MIFQSMFDDKLSVAQLVVVWKLKQIFKLLYTLLFKGWYNQLAKSAVDKV